MYGYVEVMCTNTFFHSPLIQRGYPSQGRTWALGAATIEQGE